MIPFAIEYLQAESIDEAAGAWREASRAGKTVRYFGGGTELVTGARNHVEFDVLIDLKRIPELAALDLREGSVGAAVRLSELADQREIPLLASTARGVADRTVRNSITLGGNLCSALPYRETLLPLLLFDAQLELAGPDGRRHVAVREICGRRLELRDGEFIVRARLPDASRVEGFYRRRTRDARVDYPLVTLCMVRIGGKIRFAVGGAFGYPVRSDAAEAALAEVAGVARSAAPGRAATAVVSAAAKAIPHRLWHDMRGSTEYRRALLERALTDGLLHLEDT